MDIKVEGETTSTKNKLETEELEYQLWHELSQFMNTEICYTLKRLLTADLKVCIMSLNTIFQLKLALLLDFIYC